MPVTSHWLFFLFSDRFGKNQSVARVGKRIFVPFTKSKRLPEKCMNIEQYRPGRFAYLMNDSFVGELWAYLTRPESIRAMIAATRKRKPAIMPLAEEIEERFEEELTSSAYPDDDVVVLVNNMIKQILNMHGYEHAACGICHGTSIIRSSGIFKPGFAAESLHSDDS